MFERFTDRARRVIVKAQDAARDLGHSQIRPEHLLLGLQEGEGVAAIAMAQMGADADAMRERVARLYVAKPAAKKVNKVPFSAEAKKCLEQSLRAALALGHNYIGTEHLFFGVERQAEAEGRSLDEVLGVSAAEVHHSIRELIGPKGPDRSRYSPALHSALGRARTGVGGPPTTTGDLLKGMLADPDSQVSRALATLGLDAEGVGAAVDAVDLAATTDAPPVPRNLTVTIGETSTVIADPDVAAALGDLDSEQLREILKDAVERRKPGRAAG